ncbi:hypothetical protein WM40_20185, partial [Robbsia andropogonis]
IIVCLIVYALLGLAGDLIVRWLENGCWTGVPRSTAADRRRGADRRVGAIAIASAACAPL